MVFRFFRKRKQPTRRRTPSRRSLTTWVTGESLERRQLLAGDITAAIDGSRNLVITGTDEAQQAVLTVNAATASVDLRHNGLQDGRFAISEFDKITIRFQGGDDRLQVLDPETTLDSRGITFDIDMGDGDDAVIMTLQPLDLGGVNPWTDALAKLQNFEAPIVDAAQFTTDVLRGQARVVVEEARQNLTELTVALTDEVTKTLFPAAEGFQKQLTDQFLNPFDQLIGQLDQLVTDAEELVEKAGTLASEEGPEADPDEPDEALETLEVASLSAEVANEVNALGARGQSLADGAERQFGPAGVAIEAAIQAQLAQPAEQIRLRANELAAGAEARLGPAEANLSATETAMFDKLTAVRELVRSVSESLRPMVNTLQTAASVAAKAPASGAACKVTPKHFFNGSAGADIFFPFSSPFQSWQINGGAGPDLLFGGFVDDEINGGDGTDLIMGLKGNDLIHGDRGTDLLFGEFLVDLNFLTGDDCVYGDADVDLVIGDNGLDPFTSLTTGGKDDLHGGDKQDLVIGDDLSDIWSPAGGGDDTLHGDDDIDILFGNSGNDTISGGLHIDAMWGNDGQDTLYANTTTFTGDGWMIPSTTINLGSIQFGNDQDDKIYGADGLDLQFGNKGLDEIHGNDYIDVQFGNADDDKMYGHDGGVLFTISSVPVRFGNLMFGNGQKDEMWGGGDLDVMFGNDDDDKMYGYDGNFVAAGVDADVMFGGSGDDYMEGDNESLLMVTSNDFMFGQGGQDTMNGGMQIDLMLGGPDNDTMNGDSNGLALLTSLDLMFGEDGNDTMDGGNATDLMLGNDGNDTMVGDNEALGLLISFDVMFGNNGNDTMNGGANTDIVFGNAGSDNVNGDSNNLLLPLSNDLLFGNDAGDTMDGGNGVDVMFGGDGADTMQGDSSVFGMVTSLDLMFGNEGDDRMDGGANQDLMFGNRDCDYMLGDNGASWMILSIDMMLGNEDCDEMYGGRASDLMFGNGEIDRMDGQWGIDMVYGNSGTDVIHGGDLPDILFGNDDADVIHGDDGQDLIFGNDGDDCLYGDSHADLIFGNNGNDCIHGGNGGDLLFGNDGNDLILGDAGNDKIFGNDGDDTLEGGANNDWIFGNSGDDVLYGGPGSDKLWGNSGNDTLYGGSGSPDFVFGGGGSDSTDKDGPDSSGKDCSCTIEPCKFDYGDAPNTYGTIWPGGARHGVQGPRLGSAVDYEANGIPTANSDGDDLNGSDDEDGVLLSTLTVGITQPVTVVLSNAVTALLDAWIDFNANGVFGPGEQVAASVVLAAGANAVSISVPGAAVLGNRTARFRVSSTGGLGPTGQANDGEVEDYSVLLVRRERDYGDAPDSYKTTTGVNGASHDLGGPRLGTLIDAEFNGNPTPSALGDDTLGTDDEDGVTVNPLIPGFPTSATVILSNAATARLDAWVDFNANGTFDPSEHVFNNVPIVAGSNTLSFPVPSTSVFTTYARFRVSPNGIATPDGYGGLGEVEDYRLIGETNVHDFGDAPDSYQTFVGSLGPYHTLGGPQLGTLIDFDSNGQPTVGANGDDTNNLDDEDGVVLPSLTPGSSTKANVFLSNAVTALLDGWIDFNLNGIFDHPSERIFNSVPINAGPNSVGFAVPSAAAIGTTYARFRVSTTGGMTPGGFGGLGEVEDYTVNIAQGPTNFAVLPNQTALPFAQQAAAFDNFLPDDGAIVVNFDGRAGAVDPDEFEESAGLRLGGAAAASYAATGRGTTVEVLDGYDGTWEDPTSLVMVKAPNHVDGLTLEFIQPVSAVGSFLGTGKEGDVQTLEILAFDVNGNPLHAFTGHVSPNQNADNREGFWAIRAEDAVIGSIRIRNLNTTDFGNALILDHLVLVRPVTGDPCDLNLDGVVDTTDIDFLTEALRTGTATTKHDFNSDGALTMLDRVAFVQACLQSDVGDANLDDEFNTSDFIQVFQAGKYETGEAATWSEGDWDGDGLFTTADFIAAFQAGWYERG